MHKHQKTLRLLGWITLTILAIVLLTFTSPKPVAAQEGNPVVIYMFWGEGCPHCAAAKPFFEDLANKNPEIELRFYEIYNSAENQEKFVKMAEHAHTPVCRKKPLSLSIQKLLMLFTM